MAELASSSGAQHLSWLRGRRVLVVEDEYMLAEDLRRNLESQGAEVLGPVPSVSQALELLGQAPAPDLAVLDINLQGEMVYPVADALRTQAIPFLFTTGYEAQSIPPAYADVPQTEKPLALRELLQVRQG